jgi:hypothetical protein
MGHVSVKNGAPSTGLSEKAEGAPYRAPYGGIKAEPLGFKEKRSILSVGKPLE